MSWQKVKLGQFLKNREGRYKPKDIAIQGLKRIDKINFSGTIFLSDKPSNTDMILVKKGDLVISGINVEKGAMNIYQGDDDVVATIHYSSYHFDEKQIDIDFLTNFLKSLEFKKALKEQVPGGIKTEIKPKHILPLIVEIPIDVKEQKKIVTKLISNNSNVQKINSEIDYQLDLLKQLRQAFLREAMQGKLVKNINTTKTGKQLLAEIKAEKAKLVVEKKIKKEKELPSISDDEIPFEIPKHWAWCRLGEVAFDVSYGTSQKADDNSEIPVLRMGNITSDGRILYSNLKYVSPNIKDLPKLYLKDNDLVFNRTNSYELVGKCGVFENKEAFTLASYLIRVRLFEDINSKFISHYINSSFCRKTQIEPKIIQQNGQANFNGTKLSNIIIPLPSLDEQEQIVEKLEELITFCDGLERNIKDSQVYNDMLLRQVLRESLKPQLNKKTVSVESKKIENPLKAILGGHIINLNNTTDFGRVKFQKLLFLIEYICKIDFDSNYIKKVAGPYDDALIKNIEADFNRMRFFNVVQEKTDNKRVRYHALAGASELKNLFLENFSDDAVRINNTILKFRPLSWGECELIATLYAVWNNRIIKNEPITDELLYSDFMEWDKQKKKYHNVFYKWLFWMKEERIIPDGWGKYIEKPNSK